MTVGRMSAAGQLPRAFAGTRPADAIPVDFPQGSHEDAQTERSLASGTEAFLVQRGAGSTSYRDTSTASGTRYFYRISAVNGVGEGPLSNESTAIAR